MLTEMEPFIGNTTLTNLGIGGLIAVLLVRMVLDFLLKNKPRAENGQASSAGAQPTAFWQLEFRKASAETLAQAIVPILQQHIKVLEELKEIQQDVREELRNNTTALREVLIENRVRGRGHSAGAH